VCFDFLCNLVCNISHFCINSAKHHTCIIFHVKYPFFLLDFNEPWIFPTDFRKILKSNLMKSLGTRHPFVFKVQYWNKIKHVLHLSQIYVCFKCWQLHAPTFLSFYKYWTDDGPVRQKIFTNIWSTGLHWLRRAPKLHKHILEKHPTTLLTLIVLMWRIGWAHNNARK